MFGRSLRIEESVFYKGGENKDIDQRGAGLSRRNLPVEFGSRHLFPWLKGSPAGWLLAGGGGGPCASS